MKVYVALSLALTAAAQINATQLPFPATSTGDRLVTYNETTPYARLAPRRTAVTWTPAAGKDGQYVSKNSNGDLVRQDIVTGNSTVLLRKSQIPSDGAYKISADERTVLFASNSTPEYRYSVLADYTIVDTATGASRPLIEGQAGDVQFAQFSPTGNSIAFVRGNDLFVRDVNGTVHRITTDGGPDQFNAVPDWVYQEEVLSGASAFWYSPDGRFIAFLSFNETGVGTFTVPYYMDSQKVAPVYPKELKLRYPKVGTTNPRVSLHLLNVETKETTNIPVDAFGDETIIGEVAWVTKTHTKFIYRAFNRVQDLEKHITVDTRTGESKVVRQRDGTDGWFENDRTIQYAGSLKGDCNATYYVDTSDESGWTHLYLYPVNGGEAIQLTSGDWDVRSIVKVDTKRKRVAFLASKRHSTERHLYSVSWDTLKTTPLVDESQPAYYGASFSTGGGYYILSYQGPEIPYQQLVSVNSTTPLRTLQSNEEYYKATQPYKLLNTTWFELQHPDGFTLNVRQTLPANFDPSKKYPVLFNPYGGPNSQSVTKAYAGLGWTAYIGSDPELEYITYIVDNRGTAGKGRKFRSAVTRQLGSLEAQDQIWAARELASRFSYINANKFGMWGWSFGGYLTAKVVEADSGAFSFGLITAPVTDWRLYDSIYTERYMKRLEENEAGYNHTAVRNVNGFKNVAGGVAIMHGTGDDNVHYQNAAALVDLLVGGGVSPAKVRVVPFTDSDHGISYNGASTYLYKFLTARLWDEVQRKDEGLVHQWSRRSKA
ncbi:extracellular dipeptidyl-peptidase Dpp4 [Cordyceps fumosorosea ARSEF 2679]|uniref:Probable dipeptidyl-aminopeptidase B n=1 Tax=Cordyceps fumosorosea (strain ARSEF 2679) TaxID=1081104 RepID=A0A167LPB3_CORFA|nr:extracellular dipeptidyl-peptidase Dpp4 [Cordyceps fumosorosea ARSEF 2679]OAA53331.1 extracellular dipeptidyl-peptidase Dpp4 [Cordyceps fumosorosea ARSEF 2679]